MKYTLEKVFFNINNNKNKNFIFYIFYSRVFNKIKSIYLYMYINQIKYVQYKIKYVQK